LNQILSGESNAPCYPKVALFCFANALVAYNAFSIVEAAIAAAHGRDAVDSRSHDDRALEISKSTDGMRIALPVDQWSCFAEMLSPEFAAWLSEVTTKLTPRTYRKSVRGPQKPKRKKKSKKRAVDVSTKAILDKRAQNPC
jgi:hypothetical protein